jgi:hypothetical protein
MSTSLMDETSQSPVDGLDEPGPPAQGLEEGHAEGGVVSANLRVLRAADGERRCLVMVRVGSASVCLPIDEARQAVTDAHDLPRQIEAAIAIADQVEQHRRPNEGLQPEGSTDVEEPAGDGDDGVISGGSRVSGVRASTKVSLPRRLCRGLLSRS